MCQGRSRAVTVKGTLAGPVQVRKAAAVTDPMSLPGSPLPALSFPDTFEDVQVPAFPVSVPQAFAKPWQLQPSGGPSSSKHHPE